MSSSGQESKAGQELGTPVYELHRHREAQAPTQTPHQGLFSYQGSESKHRACWTQPSIIPGARPHMLTFSYRSVLCKQIDLIIHL